jgi:hypothetical protein
VQKILVDGRQFIPQCLIQLLENLRIAFHGGPSFRGASRLCGVFCRSGYHSWHRPKHSPRMIYPGTGSPVRRVHGQRNQLSSGYLQTGYWRGGVAVQYNLHALRYGSSQEGEHCGSSGESGPFRIIDSRAAALNNDSLPSSHDSPDKSNIALSALQCRHSILATVRYFNCDY